MPLTQGFTNLRQLNRHFQDHGAEFGANSTEEYQARADAFLGTPCPAVDAYCHECIQASTGHTIRFHRRSNEFGLITQDGYILTYYILRARHSIQHPTNHHYWKEQCKK